MFSIQSGKDSLKRIAEQRQFRSSSGERQFSSNSAESQFRSSVQREQEGSEETAEELQQRLHLGTRKQVNGFCVINMQSE
jgi:hypothetical protein